MNKRYIFTTARLGFRNWEALDIPKLAAINADPKVMEHFPSTFDLQRTEDFIKRMQKQFSEKGFCYFAVDRLTDHEFIGFIGISEQTFEAEFTPCVDIGWRLSQTYWGKGYATEGAKACLDFAFNTIGLQTIKSICPVSNDKSEHVMEKIGMKQTAYFKHPLLKDYPHLEECVLYEIDKTQFYK